MSKTKDYLYDVQEGRERTYTSSTPASRFRAALDRALAPPFRKPDYPFVGSDEILTMSLWDRPY